MCAATEAQNGRSLANISCVDSFPPLWQLHTRRLVTGLLCVSLGGGGFHPSKLTLSWRCCSAAADIDHLSVRNCALPAITPRGIHSQLPADGALLSSDWLVNSMPLGRRRCFKMAGRLGRAARFFSVFTPRRNRSHGHMWVQDDAAIGTEITSFPGEELKLPCSTHFQILIFILALRWSSLV